MNARLFYITTKDLAEAEKISKILLEKKLVACTNIISQMQSHYFWQGNSETGPECILLAKSFADKMPAIETAVMQNHSYEVPCILSLEMQSVNAGYLKWMQEQIK